MASSPRSPPPLISPSSSSSSSFSSFASPPRSSSSHVADPHFPDPPPLPDVSPAQIEEERLANERERQKVAKRRALARILPPSSSSLMSSFFSLPSPLKTLHRAPLAELEGLGVTDSKRRRRRRRHKSTMTRQRRGDANASHDVDSLPLHSSLLYYLSPHLLQRLLSHFVFNVVVLVLTLVLAVLLILRIVYDSQDRPLEALAVAILCFFSVEILLRLLAYGWQFFRHPWFLLSSILTLLSFLFVLNAFGISIVVNNTVALVLQSVYSLLRFTSISFTLTSSARRMVSTNKTRYTKHGFDLDLTYITPRVIAMGLPSSSLEGLYRNPIDEVARFFKHMHASHFLIINLCSERRYDTDLFEERVLCFPFDDHNPPPLSTIVEFCTTVDRFLAEDERNVVAVHCKGGKGRTGTMIACWLLYASMTTDGAEEAGQGSLFAEEAMKVFAGSRTEKGRGGKIQGVSGPSQKRYVQYFEQLRWSILREAEDDAGKKDEDRNRRRSSVDAIDAHPHADEHKEPTEPPRTVSPISATSSRLSRPISSPRPLRPSSSSLEEKQHSDPVHHRPQSVSPPSSSSASPSSSPPVSPRVGGLRGASRSRSARFLSSASRWLYQSPKCELLSLVLNNAIISKEKEAMGDERSRDEWNDTWNRRDNWSLVITHYRPILPRSPDDVDEDDENDHPHPSLPVHDDEEKRVSEDAQAPPRLTRPSSPDHHLIDIPQPQPPPVPVKKTGLRGSSSSSALARPSSPRSTRSTKRLQQRLSDLNSYNQRRWQDVHEYFFKARPKDDGDSDTSVVFDLSSFEENSKSLILTGDLKFQIYRGRLDLGDDDDLTNSGGRRERTGSHAQDESPQRKISRALANPLAMQTPRLFGWFWVNTAFLPPSGPAPANGMAPRPAELILRKNQVDESFQASDIDSEFNVYVHYFSPPLHKQAIAVEELHRHQMDRIRSMEEERRKREREERRRSQGKPKEAAKEAPGKKGKAAELEMTEVGVHVAGGAPAAAGAFGELKEEDGVVEDDSHHRTGSSAEASRGNKEGSSATSASDELQLPSPEDEEEEEVEEEEAEVEAEAGQADFAA